MIRPSDLGLSRRGADFRQPTERVTASQRLNTYGIENAPLGTPPIDPVGKDVKPGEEIMLDKPRLINKSSSPELTSG